MSSSKLCLNGPIAIAKMAGAIGRRGGVPWCCAQSTTRFEQIHAVTIYGKANPNLVGFYSPEYGPNPGKAASSPRVTNRGPMVR